MKRYWWTYDKRVGSKTWPAGSWNRRAWRWWPALLTMTLLLTAQAPSAPRATATGGTSTGVWIPTGSMSTGRGTQSGQMATLLSNGRVLAAGDCASPCASAELYDSSTGTWTPTGSMAIARGGHTATRLSNGQVLVAGGNNGSVLASAELYNPSTGTWTLTGSMATARYRHTATLLSDGNVLVAGGSDSRNALSGAELYDPSTGTWTTTGTLAKGRLDHSATLLPAGQVLVAGGLDSGTCCPYHNISSAELYNPSTGTWTLTGSLNTARADDTATLLPTGQVLVAGGTSGTCCPLTILSSAELYNPTSGTWTFTGSMAHVRQSPTATLLPNGTVLVAGGGTVTCCPQNPTASAEVYDPNTGIWTATGSMTTVRVSHTAALLPNGQVLVAGGWNNSSSALASAELYLQPTANLTLSPTNGFYKESLVITGTAFAPSETVNIYADITSTAPLYTATTDSSGAFVLHTTVQQGTYGNHTLIGQGQSSGLFGASPFFVTPRLIMRPSSGTVGSTIAAQGYGFGSGEAVKVYWQNPRTFLGTATANSYGSFAGSSVVTFTIPSGAPPGINVVFGTGQSTHAIGKGTVTVH